MTPTHNSVVRGWLAFIAGQVAAMQVAVGASSPTTTAATISQLGELVRQNIALNIQEQGILEGVIL